MRWAWTPRRSDPAVRTRRPMSPVAAWPHRPTSSATRSRGGLAACAGLFVTGTDTGVGKTVLSAALLAAMRAPRGSRCARTSRSSPAWTSPAENGRADHELLAALAGMSTRGGRAAALRAGRLAAPRRASSPASASTPPR